MRAGGAIQSFAGKTRFPFDLLDLDHALCSWIIFYFWDLLFSFSCNMVGDRIPLWCNSNGLILFNNVLVVGLVPIVQDTCRKGSMEFCGGERVRDGGHQPILYYWSCFARLQKFTSEFILGYLNGKHLEHNFAVGSIRSWLTCWSTIGLRLLLNWFWNCSNCFTLWTVFAGTTKTYPNSARGFVGVKDVAMAHILAYESAHSNGRYICSGPVLHFADIVTILTKLYPTYPICAK